MRLAALVRAATHILWHGHPAGHHGGMPQGERGDKHNRRATTEKTPPTLHDL
jgi:hypothetical protein